MKKLALIISLLFSLYSYSQEVEVSGKVFDSTKGRNRVRVILNDTITKLRQEKNWMDKFGKVWDDSNYVYMAKNNGYFHIKANRTDSLFFQSHHHITKAYLVADLLAMDSIYITLEPQVCIPYVWCNDTAGKHFVFIGEKIKVDYASEIYYCNIITMNSEFDAEYKIIEYIYGQFRGDTIRFTVYDHYGKPRFERYKYVLLYVSEYCNRLVHQKYQYTDLYKTVDGRWAGPYQAFDYSRLDTASRIRPEIIRFEEPVVFEIRKGADPEWIKSVYPEPYYKIENGKAIAVYGNYVKELIQLKEETVFKREGIKFK